MNPWTEADLADLRKARLLLENPGLAARIVDKFGVPIEKGLALLPANWQKTLASATQTSLQRALDLAVTSLDPRFPKKPANRLHQAGIAISGAIVGAGGLAALPLELPLSTTLMLRSIADIARSQGEDISLPESKIQCLTVFALGGRSGRDDAADCGYFAVRAALARAVSEAAQFLSKRGIAEKSAPALLRLISTIAQRFGLVISEKAAAQAIPIIGAAGGATLNLLFMDHFQKMALGHFTVRRLERIHGKEQVLERYFP
ncbi:MAG: EcsC family protein [Oligoflexia bacterium]|nr:EcsC family protein [Oligoflexia bacterium]